MTWFADASVGLALGDSELDQVDATCIAGLKHVVVFDRHGAGETGEESKGWEDGREMHFEDISEWFWVSKMVLKILELS